MAEVEYFEQEDPPTALVVETRSQDLVSRELCVSCFSSASVPSLLLKPDMLVHFPTSAAIGSYLSLTSSLTTEQLLHRVLQLRSLLLLVRVVSRETARPAVCTPLHRVIRSSDLQQQPCHCYYPFKAKPRGGSSFDGICCCNA